MAGRHLPSLDRLRALREVARTGGFSSAAASLGLTQPAVSNQIRLLEQEVGARLLERIGKTARPTPEGEVLIASAQQAFHGIEKAVDSIALMSASIAGQLTLAAGTTATKHLLPLVLAELRQRHPGVDLKVLTGNTRDLVAGLRRGSTDLALLTAPVAGAGLASRFFYRDRLVCIAPAGEAPSIRSIAPHDLEGRQLVLYEQGGSIRRAMDGWLEAADRDRIRITDIGSADAQVAFVRAGFGWAIVSEVVAAEGAALGRVDVLSLAPPLSRDLVLVWRADRAARPIISAALAVFAGHARTP